MSHWVKALLAALALVLAGCAGRSHQHIAAKNWEDVGLTPAPAVIPNHAPPPPNVPTIRPAPPAGARVALNETGSNWVPLERWCRITGLATPLRLAAATHAFALHSTNGMFVLRTGSQLAHWDGLELRLGFAPQLINGQPYIHGLDLRKTVQPLLTESPEPGARSSSVIVIDAGHGGEDAGTKSVLGNRYEKEFTLDWARRLQGLLAAEGCQSLLTRSNDSELALSNRVTFAAEHNADVFLSLHFNSAAPSPGETGLETYCLTPTGMPSTLTRGYADDPALSFPNNAFDPQNLQLAMRVHRALLQVNGHQDRGVRRARFPTVLRGQQCPAILVEGGYLSNPREARLIADPAYRQKLAEAVAKALTVLNPKFKNPGQEIETGGQRPTSKSQKSEASGLRLEITPKG